MHAGAVRQIADARVKTDTEDLQRLFRLWIAAIVPDVWVPPVHVHAVRGLISSCNRLGTTATMIRNRVHCLLHRHNLKVGENGLTDATWWDSQPLGVPENLYRRQALALVSRVAQSTAERATMSMRTEWGKSAVRLLQRSGLGARIHQSGNECQDKGMTNSGRQELRWACVAAVWRAVRGSEGWKQRCAHLVKRRSEHQAMTAIARKRRVTIWYVVTHDETDRYASADDLAYTMLVLSWERNSRPDRD